MSGDLKVIGRAGLAPFTSLKVGGVAECLAEAFTTEGLKRALCNGATLLGKGSNVLCGDVDGIVVLNRTSEVSVEGNTVLAESGVGLLRFRVLRRRGIWAGLSGRAVFRAAWAERQK